MTGAERGMPWRVQRRRRAMKRMASSARVLMAPSFAALYRPAGPCVPVLRSANSLSTFSTLRSTKSSRASR